MSDTTALPADGLAALADAATQRAAASLAQDVFGEVFRNAFESDPTLLGNKLKLQVARCHQWSEQAADDEARLLRLALLVAGLDQWGVAYAQAFELHSIPALSALLGTLRTNLDERADAIFQRHFSRIEAVEADAIDFKVTLRRGIHLALWHALAACDTEADCTALVRALGSLMLALDKQMPTLGWRLLADALAHIQIALLADAGIGDIGREGTRQLFDALLHALPRDTWLTILRQSGQAVVAWQQQEKRTTLH